MAFAVAACPLVAAISRRFALLDEPGGRRRHSGPIPRTGGLALFIAFGLAITVLWSADVLLGGAYVIPEEVRSPRFRLVVLAAVLGALVGFLDDVLDLRARWQLLGQFAVAAIVLTAGIRVDFVNNPLDPGVPLQLGLLAVPFTLFWIVGMINALNFIDGLDGLAAGVSVIAAVILALIALSPQIDEPFVAWIGFTLAGALLGFLLFNFHPARLFLGTTGVVFTGTVLATLAIFGTAKVAAAMLVLGVPIIDTFYVIARRLLTGRPPFAPDRGHFHHRLLDQGLSHREVVVLIYGITAVLGAVALFATGRAQLATFLAVLVWLGILVVVLAQRTEKAQELAPDLYESTTAAPSRDEAAGS